MISFKTRRNFLLAGMSMLGTVACQKVNQSETVEKNSFFPLLHPYLNAF